MSLVAIGVSGGIGAYKAVEVVRGLQKQGHDVVCVMTQNATRFVGPLTFEAITRRKVLLDQFEPGANADIEHIAIAASIDVLIVAPATANIIGKFANGIADDFLTSLYIATKAPVLLAPAMNTNMLEHEAVRRNLDLLAARGVRFVEPGAGYLACGWIGKGRLAEPQEIVAAAEGLLRPAGPLRGARVIVTAGPTHEALDPVRFIGNRSSGKMGYALAAAARGRGAEVVLISGPTALRPPIGVELVQVTTAIEMRDAVLARSSGADVVIMAAAVADYAPSVQTPHKIHKDDETLTITLDRTPDILGELGRRRGGSDRPILVGFAAETGDAAASARMKLASKRVDMVVANDVSRRDAGFEVDDNEVIIVSPSGEEHLPLQPKTAIAGEVLDRVEPLLSSRARVST
jgi:phosphopantothenoylcysteine decarboxylase/phosphopantothenate--cysteine ligase